MQRRGTGIQHDYIAILNQRRRALADPFFRAEINNFAGVRRLFEARSGTKDGSAMRSAASALPVEDSQGSFQQRTLLHSEGKMRVARKALQFLQPGKTIVLDGSSTSWFLARQMPEMALTVITPSIRILQTLMSRRSLHLVGLGGDFSPTEESFFGETASRTLREYAIDTLFFSCQGLERDSGLYAGTEAHAALLKQMMLAACQTIALVDGSKLGRTGVARIGGLGELDCLVTEKFVDPLLEKEMTWHNVGLQIA